MYDTINNSSNWWAQLQSRRQSNYKWNAELVCTGNDNIPSVSPGMRQSDDDRISKIFKFFIYKKWRRVWNWRIHSSLERVRRPSIFPSFKTKKKPKKIWVEFKSNQALCVTSWCLFLIIISSFKMESQISKKIVLVAGKRKIITNDFHVLLSVLLHVYIPSDTRRKLSEIRTHIH